MPALLPTTFTGKITWLGVVPADSGTIRSEFVAEMFAGFSGVDGERHGGLTRPSCARTSAQYKVGTMIRNVRQFSIMSVEELAKIAALIGIDAVDPAWMGASMVIEGIPDFSHVPPSSRLQTQDGTSLTLDMENRPCIFPGQEIEKDVTGAGNAFKAAAKDLRGVTAWAEREGMLRVGDNVRLHIPGQPAWAHINQARG